MTRTHGRIDGADEHAGLGGLDVARRPETRTPDRLREAAPALTTGADPRMAGNSVSAAGLLALQRSAGNAAVASLVGEQAPVQRSVVIDEVDVTAGPAPTPYQQEEAGTGEPVTSDGGTTTIHGSAVSIEAAMTEAHGVLRADTIIADSVVASSYSPGAGNVW